MDASKLFVLSDQPIDVALQRSRLTGQPAAGAYASFEGWVRNVHLGRVVTGLYYEANEVLARSTATRILEDAIKRHGLLDIAAVHRVGSLQIGEIAIWVGTCAAHRANAFAGCMEVVDRIKAEAPIWKLERYAGDERMWVSADLVKTS